MRICIIGDTQDLSAVYIGWLARRREIEVLELPEDTLGVDWMFALELPAVDGWLEVCGARMSFSDFSGAFVRLNPDPGLPSTVSLGYLERGALIAERRSALHCLLGSLPCLVANRPSAGRANGSKPYQMHLLADAGFHGPEWVATNDPTVASDFERSYPAVLLRAPFACPQAGPGNHGAPTGGYFAHCRSRIRRWTRRSRPHGEPVQLCDRSNLTRDRLSF
jgi:hypothetical protein